MQKDLKNKPIELHQLNFSCVSQKQWIRTNALDICEWDRGNWHPIHGMSYGVSRWFPVHGHEDAVTGGIQQAEHVV